MQIKKFKSTIFWTRTAILLALALIFQMGGFPQPITGPVINAILFLSVFLVGPAAGISIGILTPIMAFIRGILPPPLGPLIPFIAIGNSFLVLVYAITSKVLQVKIEQVFTWRRILAMVIAAIIKFLILAGAVTFLVEIPPPIAQMMTLPQLYTALVGALIALLIYKTLPFKKI